MGCAQCGEEHAGVPLSCPRTGERIGGGPCGTRIEGYLVERWIGGGSFASVYRARQVMLGQAVALKLLRPRLAVQPEIVTRFLREARACAAIVSPHVVKTLYFGTGPTGQPYLVLELLEGRTLQALIESEGRVEVGRAIEIAQQMLDGLGAAHAAGVVHRDLKPANVFLTAAPAGPFAPRELVKILDFGISKIKQASEQDPLTRTGMVIGTPLYMPPEQARGGARDVDARADLYAVGVILYQLVSGHLPYRGDSYEEVIVQVCTAPPTPLRAVAPHLPPALLDAVDRAMAADPAARFASASEMSAGLAAIPLGRAGLATPQATGPTAAALRSPVPASGASLAFAPTSYAFATPAPVVVGAAASPKARVHSDSRWWIAVAVAGGLLFAVIAVVAVSWALLMRPEQPEVVFAPPTANLAPGTGRTAPFTGALPTPVGPASVNPETGGIRLPGLGDDVEVSPGVLGGANRAPAPAADGVGIGLPTRFGEAVSPLGLQELVTRARPAVIGCRGARAESVRVMITLADDGEVAASPYTSSGPAVACVAAAFDGVGSVRMDGPGGPAVVEVALAPR